MNTEAEETERRTDALVDTLDGVATVREASLTLAADEAKEMAAA